MNNLSGRSGNTLNVWVLADAKPGHVNQTEGLVKALSTYRKITVTRLPLLGFFGVSKMWLLKKCGKDTENGSPDLLIGTGHLTHLSLLAYKKCYGGKVVIMMSPSLPYGFFDMCLVPRHDLPRKRKNIVETLGAINKVLPSTKFRKKQAGLILLGGPSKHYRWDSVTVIKQIQKLLEGNPNAQWVIAGSRRTPEEAYTQVKNNFPGLVLVLPENTSTDWLSQKMLESEQVWVTSDSISMIYEALTSGAKTGILALNYEKPTRITAEMDRLLREEVVISVDTLKLTPSVTVLHEADRCAQLLLEKFDL